MMPSSKEEVVELCELYINGKSDNVPYTLAKGISESTIDLLVVVEALGSFLTSKDIDHRSQGTKLLSEVLTFSRSHVFSSSEVQYLTAFFCDRLKDSALITPHVLQGLVALASHQTLSGQDVVTVIRSIFREIHNQSQPQTSRRMVYSLLHSFLVTNIEAVRQVSSEFLLGYIQGMDGEKDPRNLLIVFSTIPVITKHLDFTVLVEDLFEVLSCYFPINFTPSPTDPDVVSKEDLVRGLRESLTSTPQFAEFLIPLLIDKLSSDLHGSKIDSLETLTVGAPQFGIMGLRSYVIPVWEAIRQEVFHPVADNVEATALSCLRAVTCTISQSVPLLEELTSKMLQDCSRYLSAPDLSLLQPSSRLLIAASSSSVQAYSSITQAVIPLLVKQLEQSLQVSKRTALLKVIVDFIKAFQPIRDTHPDNGTSPSHLLRPLITSILSFMSEDSSTLCCSSLTTLAAMLEIHSLSNNEAEMVCGDILRLATETKDPNIRSHCIKCISVMDTVYPSAAVECIVPFLTAHLMQSSKDKAAMESSFFTVRLMTAVPTHFDTTLPVLVNLLKLLATGPCSEGDWSLAIATSEAVKDIVLFDSTHSRMDFCSEYVVPELLKNCVFSSVNASNSSESVLFAKDVIANVSNIIRFYNLSVQARKSQQFSANLIKSFVTGSLSAVLLQCNSCIFQPLQPTSPWQQTQLLAFLTAVLSTAKGIDLCNLKELLSLLVQFSLESTHDASVEHAAKGCGCIANRLEDGGCGQVEQELESLWSVISDGEPMSQSRRNALVVFLWICKGLLIESNQMVLSCSQKLLSLFSDEVLSTDVVRGFSYPLLGDPPDCLNQECQANIRLFHRQWFFSQLVPQLQDLYQFNPSVRPHTIQVLSYLMQSIPKQVLLSEVPKLLPLLLESLNPSASSAGQESGVLISSLTALLTLISDAPAIIGQHVSSLVPRLLQLAKTSPQMRVRICSLQCLGALTSLSSHLVYPHQSHVIRELASCLDDRKRLVRKEAVDSRTLWYTLGREQ